MQILQEENIFLKFYIRFDKRFLFEVIYFKSIFIAARGMLLLSRAEWFYFEGKKIRCLRDLKNYYKAILVFQKKKLLIPIWCNASFKWFISYILLPFIGYILNISSVYWIYFYMSSIQSCSFEQILTLQRHGFSYVMWKIAEAFGYD